MPIITEIEEIPSPESLKERPILEELRPEVWKRAGQPPGERANKLLQEARSLSCNFKGQDGRQHEAEAQSKEFEEFAEHTDDDFMHTLVNRHELSFIHLRIARYEEKEIKEGRLGLKDRTLMGGCCYLDKPWALQNLEANWEQMERRLIAIKAGHLSKQDSVNQTQSSIYMAMLSDADGVTIMNRAEYLRRREFLSKPHPKS